ncbi:UDP-2,4-diacetamido-2,4,6-trideoxy-beta-L-altropyranose hydrolase [Alteromonas sp. 5E99-2]|uniref:UDP-2,4-diacetamido-2,4, 6-trideoxy-beta-L-altropyranose hydrolase n=1 Tax=Alteromonas sp. 5E99-2 TaxID=2817683 RepID=UPI001A99342C|nr:UDP-2,4-diacetamido-2,4,6-trideoxy-beta-L-altropyranose hydrolase [Alteromonas sp. 5E99-2]MBO1255242.1 UDP-2,4-diacetamido-2,4,6-trideoxy-beta-L-altropyranose hydrolase [Alteromonas sp. 5E99-2]
MHVAFFTEGSSRSGMGHLLRCLALAQALQSKKHKITFVLDLPSIELVNIRSDWIGNIVEVAETFSASSLTGFSHEVVDWVVIDSYNVPPDFFKLCKNACERVALFDDLVYTDFEHVDLVINSAMNHNQYQNKQLNTRFALGHNYRILRREFTEIQPKSIDERNTIVLCLGGADTQNLTGYFLELLVSLPLNYAICVVTGPAYKYVDDLNTLINRMNKVLKISISHKHNVQNMAEVWGQALFAVSAGGSSQFELLACHTPSLLIVVASNQRHASKLSNEQGWAEIIEYSGNQQTLKNDFLRIARRLIESKEKLILMQQRACFYDKQRNIDKLVGEFEL